mgnify:FL=1
MSLSNIPIELRELRQWVCWRRLQRGNKTTKSPIQPGGGFAKSNDPSTWTSFEAAKAAMEAGEADGVGIMFAAGLCGVDIDDCIQDGIPSAMALDIVDRLGSYAEISPSGTGIHILGFGSLPPGGRRNDTIGLEMYDSGRYFTVTGNPICGPDGKPYPLLEITPQLAEIHKEYFAPKIQRQETLEGAILRGATTQTDDAILQKMFAGKGGDKLERLYGGSWEGRYSSQSSADQALCNALAFYADGDRAAMDRLFRASGLMRQKWDRSVGNGQTYGERTLQNAIEGTRKDPPKRRRGKAPIPEPPPESPSREPAPPAPKRREKAPEPERYTLDDTGNAYRFRDAYRDRIRYNFARDSWMVWDGRRWKVDEVCQVKQMADELLYSLLREAEGEGDADLAKHVRRSLSSKNKENMIKEARHLEGVPIYPAQLDRFGQVINLPNGVYHLQKGTVKPHHPEYYLSKLAGAPYQPGAACPHWLAFLEDVTLGDPEMIAYLQALCGYCLTGSTQEQCMYFLYGNGSNGKSTFMATLTKILGDYAANAQPETLMMRDKTGGAQARSDIARLEGSRMVSTFEPNAGVRLDEGMVKQMTGGDKITARYLYKADFEFLPEFKILMATNYKPEIRGTDDGIWRRIRLIPFEASIPEEKKDKALPQKLAAEMPGILNWMLEGAQKWYRDGGFPPCERIDGASREYRQEMDHMAQFLAACTQPQPGGGIKAKDLYAIYTLWARNEGLRYPKSASRFGLDLKKRLKSHRGGKGVYYDGLTLSPEGKQLREAAMKL